LLNNLKNKTMSNKQKTAVDWLVEQLNKQGFAQVVTDAEIQQAQQIYKQDIMESYEVGFSDGGNDARYGESNYSDAEQYYNLSYGGQDND
jgi:hypothetical protein